MNDTRRTDRATRAAALFSLLGTAVAVLVPLLVTLDRFRRPTGEKFIFGALAGSADLWLPYNGARALLAGIDPYMVPLPLEFRDPSNWPSNYPPTMLLLYTPLVLATGSNVELACQVFYWLNLAALGVFAFVVYKLCFALREGKQDSLGIFMVVLVALSLNPATMFAIDRGQSEIINAAQCWLAVLLFNKKRMASAMAVVTLAAAFKGYAAIFAIGLLLAAPNRKLFLRGAVSAVLVTLAVTLPVAGYLLEGLQAMRARMDFHFKEEWYNHSFKSAFLHLTPGHENASRYVMLALTAIVVVIAWWRLSVASRAGDQVAVRSTSILFATTALALMVGFPDYSGIYNYLLVLPGLLLLATRTEAFTRSTSVGLVVGASAPLALALGLMMRRLGSEVPLAGLALIYLVLAAGALSVVNAMRTAPSPQTSRLPELEGSSGAQS